MQINTKIFQLLGGMYANISNVYAIKGDSSLILIDSAENEHDYKIIQENLKKWELDQYPISYVLLSHKHFGHIGNAWRFQKQGAKIIAGKADSYGIESGNIHEIIDYSPFPEHDCYQSCHVDIPVSDGDELLLDGIHFKFISAPGHTQGSTIFMVKINDKNILFTGDVLGVTNECHSASLGWEGGVDFDIQAYWNSLNKLSDIECDQIFPGHGQLCLQNGSFILKKAKGIALLKFRKPSIENE